MPSKKTTKLLLARSGGVAGIRPPPKALDTGSLSPEVAQHIEDLLNRAGFFSLPGELPDKTKSADGFQHTLTVRHSDGCEHSVTFSEGSASEALRELKRLIRDHAKC